MKLKTFQEIRQTTQVYPTTLDIFEADKQAINSWFDTRYVCDNDKFVTFFQRVLIRDYGLYRELLRTEPHISKYDWLVQQYTESQTYEKGNDYTQSNGTTNGTTNSTTDGTTTHTDTEESNSTDIKNFNGTTTDLTTANGSSGVINGGSDVTTGSGKSENDTTTTTTPTGSETTKTSNHNNVKALNREAPMSVEYASGANIDKASGNTGALEWKYLTAQAENDTRDDNTTTTSFNDRKDTTKTSAETSETTNNKTTYGSTSDTTTFNNETKTGTHNDTENGTHNGNTTHNGTDESTTENKTVSDTTTANEAQTQRQNLRQYVTTGRSIDTATLLAQAQAFIMNSSAFQWLYSRLDTCFMGIYNDDDNYCL